ncbi:hypothetical protein VTG60DRAFT_2391 [Thermothelomyces hinnuleus]
MGVFYTEIINGGGRRWVSAPRRTLAPPPSPLDHHTQPGALGSEADAPAPSSRRGDPSLEIEGRNQEHRAGAGARLRAGRSEEDWSRAEQLPLGIWTAGLTGECRSQRMAGLPDPISLPHIQLHLGVSYRRCPAIPLGNWTGGGAAEPRTLERHTVDMAERKCGGLDNGSWQPGVLPILQLLPTIMHDPRCPRLGKSLGSDHQGEGSPLLLATFCSRSEVGSSPCRSAANGPPRMQEQWLLVGSPRIRGAEDLRTL